MAKEAKLYLVMKLHTEVEGVDSGQKVKLKGCAGYIPVYKNLLQALEAAKGRYEIQAITVTAL